MRCTALLALALLACDDGGKGTDDTGPDTGADGGSADGGADGGSTDGGADGGTADGGAEGDGGGDGGGEEEALRCRREGYPCTLAEADPAALERALELAATVAEALGEGSSGEEAAALVAAEPDLVELWADGGGVLLRLASTPPVVASDPLATADLPAAPEGPPPPDVVGDPGALRTAIILDGMAAELAAVGFRSTGEQVAEALLTRPEYEGGVALHATTEAAPSLPLGLLDGLDAYDVVAWEVHGKQLCRCPDALAPADDCDEAVATDCLTHLFLGFEEDYGPEIDDRPGVSLAVTPGGTRWITVSSDFFFDTYPGGLDDALVLVDACESMQGDDLAKAFTGADTATVGWTDSVYSSDVARLIDAFLGRMLDLGLHSDETLRQLVLEGAVTGRATPVGDAPVFGAGADSAAVRVREVISLHDPVDGDPWQDGSVVDLDGVPGDGAADRLALSIRVVGVAEGDAKATNVRVEGGGDAVFEAKLEDGTETFAGEWQVDGTLELGRDLSPGESLLLKATALLPEGGTSEQTVEVQVSGLVVTFDVSLEGEGADGSFAARWTGEADLTWDSERSAWAGSGPLDYPEATITIAGGLCVVESMTLEDGALQIPRLLWTGVATETVADVWLKEDDDDLTEDYTLLCEGIGPGGTDLRVPQSGALALAAFLAAHEAEWDTDAGVFTFSGFTDPGESGVLARWEVDRSAVVDGMTLREQSQLSLRAR